MIQLIKFFSPLLVGMMLLVYEHIYLFFSMNYNSMHNPVHHMGHIYKNSEAKTQPQICFSDLELV